MENKKEKRDTPFYKKANEDFQRNKEIGFQKGGNAAYQPRDANTRKAEQNVGNEKQIEHSMQAQSQTFGQKVQKSEKQQSKESDTFTEHKSTNFQNKDAKQPMTNRTSKAYAKKQMYQSTSGQKVQKSEKQQSRENDIFTEHKGTNFQNRDTNAKQPMMNHTSKAYAKRQRYQSTFGQKVQKSEKQQSRENDTFTEHKGTNFQNRDTNAKQPMMNHTSKAYAKRQRYQSTFGQKVQKPEKQQSKENNTFTEHKSTNFQNKDADAKQPVTNRTSKAYAKRQIYQSTFEQKVQKSEKQQSRENDIFTEHKGTNFHNGDADVKQRVTNCTSKVYTKKQMYQSTFGQNVQKSGDKSGQEEKSDFAKESNTFIEQNIFSQPEETEKRQTDTEDYHHRDTYRQSQKKGKYHKKWVQKEHQGRGGRKENTKNDTFAEDVFTENTGNAFQEERGSEFTGSKKLQKKQKQAQKAGKKVQRARAKVPKTRKYTLQRVFDEKTGKGSYVIVPMDREKPFKQEGMLKITMRRVQNESRNFVHGKIAETEKENSAVEGAHKTEQKGEDLLAFVKRRVKGKEQKQWEKVAKLEKKQFQKEVNFQYQKFLEENPQMQKKALQKRLQKQRIKREYIKARKKVATSKAAEQAFEKQKNGAITVARKLQEFARKNAALLVTAGIMALLFIMVMVSVSSCGAMFVNMQSTILAGSYLSEPKEIDAADLQFTRLELDLQNEIDRVETDYPGYDEYSYNLGEIGHNPFTLISYLSAIHTEFTASEVENEIQVLFDEMYTLTLMPDTETRTRTVTKIGTIMVIDPDTGEETEEQYEYEEEEEYEVSILKVTLTVIPLESLASGKMDTEQAEIFAMYQETGGLLQEFASPLNLYWYYYVSSYYGYRKNPSTGDEELHRGVDIAVPTGTTVYAAHDGTVTAAAYDSHYGNYVVVEKDGYTAKYAHMDTVSVSVGQEITKGMVIGTTGNTGNGTGNHLHIECLYNGEYYNPLFYFDVGEGTLYGEME